jgi:hypothetical protein
MRPPRRVKGVTKALRVIRIHGWMGAWNDEVNWARGMVSTRKQCHRVCCKNHRRVYKHDDALTMQELRAEQAFLQQLAEQRTA